MERARFSRHEAQARLYNSREIKAYSKSETRHRKGTPDQLMSHLDRQAEIRRRYVDKVTYSSNPHTPTAGERFRPRDIRIPQPTSRELPPLGQGITSQASTVLTPRVDDSRSGEQLTEMKAVSPVSIKTRATEDTNLALAPTDSTDAQEKPKKTEERITGPAPQSLGTRMRRWGAVGLAALELSTVLVAKPLLGALKKVRTPAPITDVVNPRTATNSFVRGDNKITIIDRYISVASVSGAVEIPSNERKSHESKIEQNNENPSRSTSNQGIDTAVKKNVATPATTRDNPNAQIAKKDVTTPAPSTEHQNAHTTKKNVAAATPVSRDRIPQTTTTTAISEATPSTIPGSTNSSSPKEPPIRVITYNTEPPSAKTMLASAQNPVIESNQSLEQLKRMSETELMNLWHSNQLAYLEMIKPAALEVERVYGIPAEFVLAQASLDMSSADKFISQYNLFGIKGKGTAGSRLIPINVDINGTTQIEYHNFAKYNNIYDAIMQYGALFHNGSYEQAIAAWANDFDTEKFIRSIEGTYSNNPKFIEIISEKISRYGLDIVAHPDTIKAREIARPESCTRELCYIDSKGNQLRKDAAIALKEASIIAGHPITIHKLNAYRTPERQQELVDAYAADPVNNAPADPPELSKHVKGIAIDIEQRDQASVAALNAAGFFRTHSGEEWHFDFLGEVTVRDDGQVQINVPEAVRAQYGE